MITDGQPPEHLIGLALLARVAFNGGDLKPIAAHLLERSKTDAGDATALLDLSTVLQLMGHRDSGLAVQALALDTQRHYRSGSPAEPPRIRLLSIHSPGDLTRNNAVEFLVESADIELQLLYVTPEIPLPATLPDHDIAIVAVCQSEQNRPLLKHLEQVLNQWPRPLLCAPDRINRLSREGAAQLLRSVPGAVMPATIVVNKRTLEGIGRFEIGITELLEDGDFPIIIRPIDSNKGFGLARLDQADGIAEYLKDRQEEAFNVARYVDYIGQDGLFRKYRIVLIDERPYVCHMAISASWMVHYMSAGMFESAEKRDEESRFFASFDGSFAARHHDAFLAIARRLELEYVGIDCGETPDGKLLVFEVDSGMTVHSMDPPELFPYKRGQMSKVFQAFRSMLIDASDRWVREDAA